MAAESRFGRRKGDRSVGRDRWMPMRLTGASPASVARGLSLVLVGIGLFAGLLFLELSEGARTTFLPPGAVDDLVDTALATTAGIAVAAGGGLLLAGNRHVWKRDAALRRRARRLRRTAAHRMGDADSRVRLQVLSDLELLGQASAADRQAVVDCWCAYLRRVPAGHLGVVEPRDPDPTLDVPAEAVADLQVRRAVQAMIARHLRPVTEPDVFATHWREVRDLNVDGAALIDLDWGRCHVPGASFIGATFHGTTSFDEATFERNASFDDSMFLGDVSFRRTTFRGDAWFHQATFNGMLRFESASFQGDAAFNAVRAKGQATFRRSAFSRRVHFDGAVFDSEVDMTDTRVRKRRGQDVPHGWAIVAGPEGWSSLARAPQRHQP